jgi:hypothetical protein
VRKYPRMHDDFWPRPHVRMRGLFFAFQGRETVPPSKKIQLVFRLRKSLETQHPDISEEGVLWAYRASVHTPRDR